MKYSVVIPLKNEQENIVDLVDELEPIMNALGKPWELICIDDGSTDETRLVLQKLGQTRSNLRLIAFQKNYGQSSAFDAGFKAAQGEFVITLDGDRQNDPGDIPKLIQMQAAKELDLVCGYRASRKDPWHKRWSSYLANAFRNRICKDGVRDTGCSLKLYRRKCLGQIKMYQGMHRFLPALFINEGFNVQEVPVNHRPRVRGVTKYGFWNRSLNTLVDLWAVRWMRVRQLNYQIEKEQ